MRNVAAMQIVQGLADTPDHPADQLYGRCLVGTLEILEQVLVGDILEKKIDISRTLGDHGAVKASNVGVVQIVVDELLLANQVGPHPHLVGLDALQGKHLVTLSITYRIDRSKGSADGLGPWDLFKLIELAGTPQVLTVGPSGVVDKLAWELVWLPPRHSGDGGNEKGLLAWSLDIRGHGKDDGLRVVVDSGRRSIGDTGGGQVIRVGIVLGFR